MTCKVLGRQQGDAVGEMNALDPSRGLWSSCNDLDAVAEGTIKSKH